MFHDPTSFFCLSFSSIYVRSLHHRSRAHQKPPWGPDLHPCRRLQHDGVGVLPRLDGLLRLRQAGRHPRPGTKFNPPPRARGRAGARLRGSRRGILGVVPRGAVRALLQPNRGVSRLRHQIPLGQGIHGRDGRFGGHSDVRSMDDGVRRDGPRDSPRLLSLLLPLHSLRGADAPHTEEQHLHPAGILRLSLSILAEVGPAGGPVGIVLTLDGVQFVHRFHSVLVLCRCRSGRSPSKG
mmetsp:Transcript_52570/g.157546  ORF Transcript_52570/g.157546 Transcript_52570/m.157546 type:complete len:237 (+) Transcript_52570:110-820(+)